MFLKKPELSPFKGAYGKPQAARLQLQDARGREMPGPLLGPRRRALPGVAVLAGGRLFESALLRRSLNEVSIVKKPSYVVCIHICIRMNT